MSQLQIAVFRELVRDHLAPPPLVVDARAKVGDVVRQMAASRASAAVITDAVGAIAGILTEQDVVRRVAAASDAMSIAQEPVQAVMTAPVLTLPEDSHLFEAIGFMRRKALRHMPVVGQEGKLTGMVYLHEALAVATGPLASDIDRLTREDSFDGLAEVKAALVALAGNLLDQQIPAPQILGLVSHINNDIYRRVLRLILIEMAAEGKGPPPVAFDAIVMGSGGRGESYLFPDQDNGFILADHADERCPEVDGWFVACAESMTKRLDEFGFPLCKGGVMATNPLWRKSLSQWKEQLSIWMRRLHPQMLLSADIFFDFRAVFGSGELAAELRRYVTVEVPKHSVFMREIFGFQAGHRAGVGLFNRFITERRDERHKGHIDLKMMGTLPLSEAVRLMALMAGAAETETLQRLAVLKGTGKLPSAEADDLAAAFELITGLQLRQQLRDHARDLPLSTFVDPDELGERERQELKEGFHAINACRARLKAELTGQLV